MAEEEVMLGVPKEDTSDYLNKGQNFFFDIICLDLSLNRPGFAALRYYPSKRMAVVQQLSSIDNKTNRTKCHGEKLYEIARQIRRYMIKYPGAHIVREEALSVVVGPKAKSIPMLYKVVGVSDLYAWWLGERQFDEVNPKTVKRRVTGDSLAQKEVVASALRQFVGDVRYKCDDESDAVAVGIAWLLENNMIDDPYEKPVKKKPKKEVSGT